MGAVVTFIPRRRRRRGPADRPLEGAQIVFFPGVRIERHTIDLSRRISGPAVRHGQRPAGQ